MDYQEKILHTIEYIEQNLKEKLSLEELAEKTFLSKFHYHRMFHELTGETVMAYIRKRRLTEASRELMESDAKIVDVALKYQFGSQETFSRAFKKMYQVSPGEFRRTRVSALRQGKEQTHGSALSMCAA